MTKTPRTKRKLWRPHDYAGKIRGGAGGFHLPQTERKSYLNTNKRRGVVKKK